MDERFSKGQNRRNEMVSVFTCHGTLERHHYVALSLSRSNKRIIFCRYGLLLAVYYDTPLSILASLVVALCVVIVTTRELRLSILCMMTIVGVIAGVLGELSLYDKPCVGEGNIA